MSGGESARRTGQATTGLLQVVHTEDPKTEPEKIAQRRIAEA